MSTDIHQHKILILDFGSQYTQLIARRIREIGVYCELHSHDMLLSDIQAFSPSGIILSGGPDSVTLTEQPAVAEGVFELDVPILGICYGMQLMASQLGGKVESSEHKEFGHTILHVDTESGLFSALDPKQDVWMSHADKVIALPDGFKAIAESTSAPIAAMENPDKHFYALQFHPEVTHTENGFAMLQHFCLDICQCEALWTPANIIDECIADVREKVGGGQVILGLSGGVDSSVVAALLDKAIGKQLTCIFVDNGYLRLHEADQVMETFSEHMDITVMKIDAKERFSSALKNVSDPEEKRKIAGREFVKIFEEESAKLKNANWLAQGTIYPDVIESAGIKTGKAKVIKSHHNVGGLPDDMKLELLEPLRELFKDEVRKVGVSLGLAPELVFRHPFPGPGLCIRILGEAKQEYANILRQADAIFISELRKNDLYDKVSQAFAVFLPIKSVGVVGDNRQYEYVIALRAVETIDFMTARWANLPYEFLSYVSNRIVNEVAHVSRVVYDISGKPPATIEWE